MATLDSRKVTTNVYALSVGREELEALFKRHHVTLPTGQTLELAATNQTRERPLGQLVGEEKLKLTAVVRQEEK